MERAGPDSWMPEGKALSGVRSVWSLRDLGTGALIAILSYRPNLLGGGGSISPSSKVTRLTSVFSSRKLD